MGEARAPANQNSLGQFTRFNCEGIEEQFNRLSKNILLHLLSDMKDGKLYNFSMQIRHNKDSIDIYGAELEEMPEK